LYLYEDWDGANWELGYGNLSFKDSFGNNYSFGGGEIKIFYKTITEVNENELQISDFSLSQNYPNPFNPSTIIRYSIPRSTEFNSVPQTTLKVYDILGKEIATLVNESQKSGNYEVEFNASNFASGVYFYRLQSGNPDKSGQVFTETKKMILLR